MTVKEKEYIVQEYQRMYTLLDHLWLPPRYSSVTTETILQIYNVEITLLPNHTYYLSDLSGG